MKRWMLCCALMFSIAFVAGAVTQASAGAPGEEAPTAAPSPPPPPQTQAPAEVVEEESMFRSYLEGWYIGGGLAMSMNEGDLDILREEVNAEFEADIDRIPQTDDDDFAWKVLVGWRFHKHFSVEAAWVDLGEYEGGCGESGEDACSGDFSPLDSVAGALEVQGGEIVGTAFYGIFDDFWDLFAKGGVYIWDADAKAIFRNGTEEVHVDDNDSGVSAVAGGGIQLNATELVALRLEYERFFDIVDGDINLVTLAAIVRFG